MDNSRCSIRLNSDNITARVKRPTEILSSHLRNILRACGAYTEINASSRYSNILQLPRKNCILVCCVHCVHRVHINSFKHTDILIVFIYSSLNNSWSVAQGEISKKGGRHHTDYNQNTDQWISGVFHFKELNTPLAIVE